MGPGRRRLASPMTLNPKGRKLKHSCNQRYHLVSKGSTRVNTDFNTGTHHPPAERAERLRQAARHWKDRHDEEVERKRVVATAAIATAASVVATAATETPRARMLTQKEWAEEQWDAESAWQDAESAWRCGGDGVAAQEGKIQKVRGVAAGGVHPAQV